MSGDRTNILHVIGSTGRGGAETWLMQVLRHFDRDRFNIDVMVNNEKRNTLAEDFRKLNCQIHVCGPHSDPFRYARRFIGILSRNGPYQVVHCHLQLFNGFLMALARYCGVPVRIAHARNCRDANSVRHRRLFYQTIMRLCLARYATHRLAVSRVAAFGTYGRTLGNESNCHIVSSGIDFSLFLRQPPFGTTRKELGLLPHQKVIGHVGSFTAQKNHTFLIEIASFVIRRNPDAIFMLIGNGPLKVSIEQKVSAMGILSHFMFIGEVTNVPDLMMGAMDLFLFPSLYEGLPRALNEAQAAGLPCIASDTVTDEARALPQSVRFLSLDGGAPQWADVVLEELDNDVPKYVAKEAILAMNRKKISIESNVAELKRLYEFGVPASANV